jgi:hypothetical protein
MQYVRMGKRDLGAGSVKSFKIHSVTGDSTILVRESLQNVKMYISSEQVVIITDSNVRRLYARDFPPGEIIEIGKKSGHGQDYIWKARGVGGGPFMFYRRDRWRCGV